MVSERSSATASDVPPASAQSELHIPTMRPKSVFMILPWLWICRRCIGTFIGTFIVMVSKVIPILLFGRRRHETSERRPADLERCAGFRLDEDRDLVRRQTAQEHCCTSFIQGARVPVTVAQRGTYKGICGRAKDFVDKHPV